MEGPEEDDDDLIVFLKVSEEAVMAMDNRRFNWTKVDLPVVTSYTTEFDEANAYWVLNIVGTGFAGTQISDILFKIDGFEQTVLSIDDVTNPDQQTIKIEIVEMLDLVSRDVEFYLPIGTPEGADLFAGDGIVLTPRLVSVSPQIGSPASSLILVNVQGVGKLTSGITLVNAD